MLKTAEGSALIFGREHEGFLCAASVENSVPSFLRNSGKELGDRGVFHAATVPPKPGRRVK